ISLGNLEWCQGNRSAALELYRRSLSTGSIDFDGFISLFESDREQLIKHGVEPDDIPIMLDQLRYVSMD
ncbi:MAG: hypothetical protein V2A67_11120, partial [Bacteroidota bacterium]